MVDQIIIEILAYGHVLAAMGWLGGALLTTFVLSPSLQTLSPPARLEFTAKVLPKVLRFVQAAVGTTLLFGVLLFAVVGGGLTTLQSYEIFTGVILAVVVAVGFFGVGVPAFRKVIRMANDALQSNQPPSPDMMKYSKRARQASLLGVGLLFIILAMMIASGFS